MRTFRVEVTEVVTTIRETWIEAENEQAAREAAEEQDWREYSLVSQDTDSSIGMIEPTE